MKNIILCVLGTLGFCPVLNVKKRSIIYVAFGAFISAFIFETLCKKYGFDLFIASFFASLSIGIYSEIIARIKKAPSTVFFLPCSIPLLPGSSMFYAMNYLVLKDYTAFKANLFDAANISFGIALGAVATMIILFVIRKFRKALN